MLCKYVGFWHYRPQLAQDSSQQDHYSWSSLVYTGTVLARYNTQAIKNVHSPVTSKLKKHLGPSLCFKQLFHLNAKWSKCEHIESINRAKATRALNPCLCSIVIYITCHQQITTSRNPAIEETKRHLLSFASCPWTWSRTQQHTTKRLPGERQVSPSSICSPHMAKASMQAWKRRRKGSYSHDHSHFNIRPCPPHYQARVPAQWCRTWMVKKLRWTVRSWKSHITCWGEGLRNRTCSLSFYDIL